MIHKQTIGIMVSYWIDFGFYWIKGSSAQWRVPIAMQIVFAVIMIIGVAVVSSFTYNRLYFALNLFLVAPGIPSLAREEGSQRGGFGRPRRTS